MRRTRNRFYTIDAENEEEFIKEIEKKTKSKLSSLAFKDKEEDEKIQEMDEEEALSPRKGKNSFHLNDLDDDEEYSGLGPLKDLDDNEDNFDQDIDDDMLKKTEDDLIRKDNNEEKGLEILCYYLKRSIAVETKDKKSNNSESIFYKNNTLGALSGNAIYDLNIGDLIDNLLTENDNEYTKPNEGNNNSLRDYILQNIESDSNLKIMVMSNNRSTKNSFINKFFGTKNNIDKNKSKEEIIDEPFEIRKKQIKLFNKNICLQIFDTSDEFHKNSVSYVYYKTVSAFFIFIEASNHNVKTYLEFITGRLNKYIMNKTCVIFGVNMLFKEDCTIDGDNLREYANEKKMMFIPIKISDFDLKNSMLVNLLNLILIKGIDNKTSKESLRKESRDKKLGGFKNKLALKINDSTKNKNIYDITKMNVQSNLGYKKKYRMKHINAFDMEDNNTKKVRRKISADI